MNNLVIDMSINDDIIKNNLKERITFSVIYEKIFLTMEINCANSKLPIDLYFLKSISDEDDRNNVIKYLKYIYKVYDQYLFEILFNYCNITDENSGEIYTVNDYERKYDIVKTYYCTNINSNLYKIISKYY